MRYTRLKKHEGIRLSKDTIFSKIVLDFLHNSPVEGCYIKMKHKKWKPFGTRMSRLSIIKTVINNDRQKRVDSRLRSAGMTESIGGVFQPRMDKT